MLDMKNRTALLALSAGAAAIIAACSGTEEGPVTVAPSGSGTAVAPTSGATVAPTSAAVGPSGTTSNAATSTGGSGASTSGGSGGSGATSSGPETSECTVTTYEDENVGNDKAMFSAVRSIFVYGDGTTSACLDDVTTLGTVCLEGNAVDAGSDYATWGAGIGLQLAQTDTTGAVIAPWDAAAAGAVSLKFTVSNLATTRPVRIQIAQADDPAITDSAKNYQQNGFLRGGSSPDPVTEGENIIPLADFQMPEWGAANIAEGLSTPEAPVEPETIEGTAVDASKLHSLQFQASSDNGDDPAAYSFCISGVQWLDSAGAPITVVIEDDSTDSSSGDTGSGATDSTAGSEPTGSDTGSGATDSAATSDGSGDTSGGETSGAAELDYTADILPIFEAKCGGANNMCHGAAQPSGGLDLFMEAAATAAKADIAERIQREDGAQGKMPAQGSLTADELAALVTWSEQ